MPHIFSLTHNDQDIITKCLDKIIPTIQYFFHNDMIPDGWFVKTLEQNIIEFRIQLPKSEYLLRIIGAYEKGTLLLLTGHLFKPASYHDKQKTQTTDKEYANLTKHATTIWLDYKTHQKQTYVSLDSILPR